MFWKEKRRKEHTARTISQIVCNQETELQMICEKMDRITEILLEKNHYLINKINSEGGKETEA